MGADIISAGYVDDSGTGVFFYGGMVRKKNILNILMQCFIMGDIRL